MENLKCRKAQEQDAFTSKRVQMITEKKSQKNLQKQSVLPLFLYFFQWGTPLLHSNTSLKEKEKVKMTPMTFVVSLLENGSNVIKIQAACVLGQ